MNIRLVNIFFVLLVLPWFVLQKAGAQNMHFTDSLFSAIEKNPFDSTSFRKVDNLIGKLFYQDIDSAMMLSVKQYELAVRQNNKLATGRALLNIGIVHDLQSNFDSSLYYYGRSMKRAEECGLEKLRGDVYNNQSITYAVEGNIETSISSALNALAIFEKLNDSLSMAKIYNNLGSRYFEIEYYDEALNYYHKAAAINQKIGDSSKLAYNFGNIGLLNSELDNNELALEYFIRSYRLQDTVNIYNYSIALHNLGLAYHKLKQYDKALNFEERAYNIANEINDELGKITILNGLAAINNALGNHRKALNYYHQSAEIAEKTGARYYLITIYEGMADLYAQFNDYQQAFLYNQKSGQLRDSILTIEKDKALQQIKAYENDKKQQEISLLTKDSEIQKLNLKRQKTIRNSVMAVGSLILILLLGLMQRYRYVRRTKNELTKKNELINLEKDRSDKLLLNILPAETAEELKSKGHSEARHFEMVTVMFTDFKGFTFMAEKLAAQELVDEIDYCFKKFDEIISKHNIEKIKTIGDAYMCAGGLPVSNNTNPVDIVNAGLEIQEFMSDLKKQRKSKNKPYFELRLGIHTGPVVAGIVGTRKFQYDIWGDTVNIASRLESGGEVGKVNISRATYEKVKDYFACEHRGKIETKNKGAFDMYFVKGALETHSAGTEKSSME